MKSEIYTSPQVEQIEVIVEQGFAGSIGAGGEGGGWKTSSCPDYLEEDYLRNDN